MDNGIAFLQESQRAKHAVANRIAATVSNVYREISSCNHKEDERLGLFLASAEDVRAIPSSPKTQFPVRL